MTETGFQTLAEVKEMLKDLTKEELSALVLLLEYEKANRQKKNNRQRNKC